MSRVLLAWLCLMTLLGPAALADDDPPVPSARQIQHAKLQLTGSQREALDQLKRESRKEAASRRGQIRRLRRQLEALYRQYRLDPDRVRAVHRQINQAQARLLDVYLDAQQGVRRILSAEQFAALQASLRDDDEDDDDEHDHRKRD